jgi:hypothetical protein
MASAAPTSALQPDGAPAPPPAYGSMAEVIAEVIGSLDLRKEMPGL